MTSYRLRAYLYLILVATIWGAAGPVIKFTLRGIDPLPFLAYRFAISACFSLVYFLIKGVKLPKPKKALPQVIVYGLLAFPLALGALFTGLDRSTVLDLTLTTAIAPLIVTAGGAIFFHDRITLRERIGIMVVLVGVFINSFAPVFLKEPGLHFTGNLFIVAYLFFDAASTLYAKYAVRHKIPPFTLTNLGFIIAALTLIPATLSLYGVSNVITAITSLPLQYHLGVWYMALLSGTLAYFLFVAGNKSIEVSEGILFSYLQPLFSVPLAIFWLGEKITLTFIFGAIFIAVGIITAEYKRPQPKSGKQTN